jgi:DNA replication protein DnaC
MAKTIESRNRYAIENQLSYLEFISLLLEDEQSNRKSNSYAKRYQKSKLDRTKTLDNYDFSYQPEVNRKEMLD